MFHRLHIQMTVFSTLIISLILVTMTCICLFISERSLKKNMETSFSNELGAILTYLQDQDTISLQWVCQTQENHSFFLRFYDNGMPLYISRLYGDSEKDALAEYARNHAYTHFNIDVARADSGIFSSHTEFRLTYKQKPYYASVGTIPRKDGTIGFVVLSSLARQQQQITFQRVLFFAVDVSAMLLLALLSWLFNGHMLIPIEENRRKQSDFIAAASHELRSPLTVILSGVEALQKTDDPARRAHFFHIIDEEGLRMQHLISDMLFLSRSDSRTFPVHLSRCQPDLLLLDAYEKYTLSARKKKLSLSVSLPEEQLPACNADPERAAQIFSILIDNAFSYTPKGGAVRLSLSLNRKRSTILFQVADNGPGVPDSEKNRIFDRFYRSQHSHTDKNHFGLGLCIAGELARAHHGKLWVEDAPGGGAIFTFALPAI